MMTVMRRKRKEQLTFIYQHGPVSSSILCNLPLDERPCLWAKDGLYSLNQLYSLPTVPFPLLRQPHPLKTTSRAYLIYLPRNIPQPIVFIPEYQYHPRRLHIERSRSVFEAVTDDLDDTVVRDR